MANYESKLPKISLPWQQGLVLVNFNEAVK